MEIKQYDKVKLKSGYQAYIVEVLKKDIMYIGDIKKEKGYYTDFISIDEIEKVIKK